MLLWVRTALSEANPLYTTLRDSCHSSWNLQTSPLVSLEVKYPIYSIYCNWVYPLHHRWPVSVHASIFHVLSCLFRLSQPFNGPPGPLAWKALDLNDPSVFFIPPTPSGCWLNTSLIRQCYRSRHWRVIETSGSASVTWSATEISSVVSVGYPGPTLWAWLMTRPNCKWACDIGHLIMQLQNFFLEEEISS